MTFTLIGSPASYFTGKVRGYLRWKGVDFTEVASSQEVYRDIILPRIGWPVIPVVLTPDGAALQDSADIIGHFEAALPAPSVYPAGAVQRLAALLFQLYGDEWLILPAMHYRWNYNEDWIYGEFGRTSAPEASPAQQIVIGRSVGQRFRSFVPLLGVTPETIPGIEAAYQAFLADFSTHLATQPFLLGTRPSIGDFGLLGPLYAHLLRDPASGEIMRRLAPRVADWTERCHDPEPGAGEFLPGDECPETLAPMLRRQAEEQLPFLAATADLLAAWTKDQQPGTAIPRALGELPFTTGGRSGTRAAMTFSLFRLQAALDHLDSLGADERRRADDWLETIGAGVLTSFRLPCRMARSEYRLVLA